MLSLVFAAKEQPAQTGPLGLFVIVLLAIATFLLIRSMNRHLRRLPPSFDAAPGRKPAEPAEPAEPADPAATDPPAEDRPAP